MQTGRGAKMSKDRPPVASTYPIVSQLANQFVIRPARQPSQNRPEMDTPRRKSRPYSSAKWKISLMKDEILVVR